MEKNLKAIKFLANFPNGFQSRSGVDISSHIALLLTGYNQAYHGPQTPTIMDRIGQIPVRPWLVLTPHTLCNNSKLMVVIAVPIKTSRLPYSISISDGR